MALELRIAENEQDAVLAFRAYKEMHSDGFAPGSFHPVKTLTNLLRVIKGPGSALLMAMDGDKLAGVLALIEQSYWYSEDRNLIDKGLYVLPEYRDSGALDILLDAAADLSDDLGIICFIFRLNGVSRRGASSQARWKRGGNIIIHFPKPSEK